MHAWLRVFLLISATCPTCSPGNQQPISATCPTGALLADRLARAFGSFDIATDIPSVKRLAAGTFVDGGTLPR